MNSLATIPLLYVFMIACLGASQLSDSPSGYSLKWEENFNSGKLDSTIWTVIEGDGCPNLCGWGNNELQFYKNDYENIRLENEILVIEAHKKNYKNKKFTSAKLVTKNKIDWKYGKIEVRAKIPQGLGTWSAIWMLPTIEGRSREWPTDGEIDIMEHVGYNRGMIYGAVHTEKYNGMHGTHKSDSIYIADAHLSFHNYSIEWTEETITWSVDDQKYYSITRANEGVAGWPFNQFQYHLIINLAVGGNWGGKMGVDPDVWPQRLEIDHVRYYQLLED
ncbi:glycoside hydrolase family 16 protein [Ekhidna sp.]|uniref:glycoside hydrolase family 16 protein n=1 Tax=Ekhidna sp. TaxID=2608089 RepID=UPI0032EB94D2